MFSLESYGLKQLQDVMIQLPAKVNEIAAKKVSVKAARPIARQAKQTTVFSDHTKNLRRGIRVRAATVRDRRRYNRANPKEHLFAAITGGRTGPHLHLIEAGTDHRRTRRGEYRGRVQSSFFLRGLVEQSQYPAVFRRELAAELEQIIRGLAQPPPRKDVLRALAGRNVNSQIVRQLRRVT